MFTTYNSVSGDKSKKKREILKELNAIQFGQGTIEKDALLRALASLDKIASIEDKRKPGRPQRLFFAKAR